ncbi:MAG: hypothetical protein KAX49_02600 [Halanaerobiales bacterium]|nr:hypothetical protein [Halanaerobiales bacterium]
MPRKKLIVTIVLAIILLGGILDIVFNDVDVFRSFVKNVDANRVGLGWFEEPKISAKFKDDLKFDLADEEKLIIVNHYGNTEIQGSSEDHLQVTFNISLYASDDKKAEEFVETLKPKVENKGDQILLTFGNNKKLPKWVQGISSNLVIMVPEHLNIDVESLGNIKMSKINGKVKLKNNFGDISVLENKNDVEIDYHAGIVELKDIQGNINLKSTFGYGNVSEVQGNIDYKCEYGQFNCINISGNVEGECSFGSFHGISIEGNVTGEMNYTKVFLEDIRGSIKLNSNVGNVELIDFANDVDIFVRNSNIKINSKLNHQITAETDDGKIISGNDLFEITQKGSKYHLNGKDGKGEYKMKLETKLGNIILNKELFDTSSN